MKGKSIELMTEYDRSTIITEVIIESKTVNDPINWGHYRGIWSSPDVDPQMNSSRRFSLLIKNFTTTIHFSFFSITPDPEFCVGLF